MKRPLTFHPFGSHPPLNRSTSIWGTEWRPDAISHDKFCVNRLKCFSAAASAKVPFPILFRTTLTTVLHYRADCEYVDLNTLLAVI